MLSIVAVVRRGGPYPSRLLPLASRRDLIWPLLGIDAPRPSEFVPFFFRFLLGGVITPGWKSDGRPGQAQTGQATDCRAGPLPRARREGERGSEKTQFALLSRAAEPTIERFGRCLRPSSRRNVPNPGRTIPVHWFRRK